MGISEEKMNIVMDNYFKAECDVNTSIRKAFEKGFRIGAKKGMPIKERKTGKWEERNAFRTRGNADPMQSALCSNCKTYHTTPFLYSFKHYNFCPNCGAKMDGGDDNS